MRHVTGKDWTPYWIAAALLALSVALGGCATAAEPDAPAAEATTAALPAADAAVNATGEAEAGAAALPSVPGAEAASPEAAAEAPGEADNATAEQTPTAQPALALAAPSELLDSYRMAGSLVITSYLPGGAVHVASTTVQGDWIRRDGPFPFDAAFTLVNVSGDQRQELSVVAVGDDAAVLSEGAWSTIRRDAAVPYGAPDGLLALPFASYINRGENLGSEDLDGVSVTHYRLTDPALFTAAVGDMLPDGAGSVQRVQLEGWVADAGFVVKYLLQATLADADFVDEAGNRLSVQQEIDASYQLRDVDAVAAIEWPADAQPPGTIAVPGFVPNTFPLPEGATVTPRLGMIEISTPQAEAEVADFYRARLDELGWDFAGELGFYDATKDGQQIHLTILPDEVSGETQITVFAAAEP